VSGDPGFVGRTFPPQTFGPVTRTDFVRYAGASGDFNPVHHDEPYAVRIGNPSVFSMGMYQAGLLSTYATRLLGPRNIRRFAVRFRERVWPGDTLTCTATVSATDPAGDGGDGGDRLKVSLDLECRNQEGRAVLSGSADFLVTAAALDVLAGAAGLAGQAGATS
jgi:acyl dehydratase